MLRLFIERVMVTSARAEESSGGYSVSVPFGPNREYNNFSGYFLDLINFAVVIASALAVMFIVFGALKYVTSGGDESRAKDGKDIIVGSLVGLALLFLIRLIVPLLGLETG